ncbi:MmcQ/YjbR family DNA-binding protein [Palleronia pelagia]|uniref:Predicted DNA-binding protein, MmcQ/YjbR family n=1 Tax=Palleronia pelagia TaxID=387096 RepID=A0A1H8H762_9RHOB|nr:MmcQ/YjbR family DNA-binding protein [Palleronia pelagia]SEN52152.1 Predicted DNA-binding protein, MmcQ/YjbR family [Palleronia pelagia]
MTRGEIDTIAARLPGAVLSGPGELDAWKIGGKMFACFGHTETRDRNTGHVVLRCADSDSARMLIDAGVGRKPAYFRGAWLHLDLPDLDPGEARHRIAVSYDTVRAGLTKKAQAALPPREEDR